MPSRLPNRILAYPGAKTAIAREILRHLPPGGRPYCEPFCGSAAILLAREPAETEVINDIDHRVVNFFRVLQDRAKAKELIRRLRYTMHSRAEYFRAIAILEQEENADPIDKAWAVFVASMLSRAGGYFCGKKCYDKRKREDFSLLVYLRRLRSVLPRISRVTIENIDGIECIRWHDNPEAVFYVDPPYIPETAPSIRYRFHVDISYHRKLVDVLLGIQGSAVLSLYFHEAYQPLIEAGWRRIEICVPVNRLAAFGRKSAWRNEVLLVNPRAASRSSKGRFCTGSLFDEV